MTSSSHTVLRPEDATDTKLQPLKIGVDAPEMTAARLADFGFGVSNQFYIQHLPADGGTPKPPQLIFFSV